MAIKQGESREAVRSYILEELIGPENEVRVIDVFVDSLDLSALNFIEKGLKTEGRGAFGNARLLKLYLYGYLNRIRSSRCLERECERNVELWWLLERLQPGYKTISDFRKDNPTALRAVFGQFNKLLKDWELYGKRILAADSVMVRAQNSKKNNFSQDKIDRHKNYIKGKEAEYLELLEQADEQAEREVLAQKLAEQKKRLDKYEVLEAELGQCTSTQISTVDPQAKLLVKNAGSAEVVYNIQVAVDAKHCLIAHFEPTNEGDQNMLSPILIGAKQALGLSKADPVDGLADKGYFTAKQIQLCTEDNISTYVAEKTAPQQKQEGFNKEEFVYLPEQDQYVCPAGELLQTNGKWHTKNKGTSAEFQFQVYQLPFSCCGQCPHKDKCLSPARLKDKRGRYVERSEFEAAITQNRERLKANPQLYRRRQAIVEHPFGTIKRQWGYSYTLLKGKQKVGGEFALIFTCYNLRRSISIFGVKALLERLNALFAGFFDLLQPAWLISVAFLPLLRTCRTHPVRFRTTSGAASRWGA